MPDLQTALQTALSKAQPVPPPTATPTPIPSDWDDEGGAPEIVETHTATTSTAKEKPMKHLFQPTNNVSRETFNYVLNNPGATRVQAMDALGKDGHNRQSVSSLLSQMHGQGMITGSATEGYYAVATEYTPVKYKRKVREAVKQQATAPKRAKPSKPAPAPEKTLAEKKAVLLGNVAPQAQGWTPNVVLHGLSVIQSKAVYDELKKYFG